MPKGAFFASIALAVIGCTRAPEAPLLVAGWVQAGEQVRIYPRSEDLGRLHDGTCLSAVMPEGQSLPPRFQNHFVAVYGFMLDRHRLSEFRRGIVANGISDECDSAKVVLITRIVDAEIPTQTRRGASG